jgi:hypothetical protein
VGGRAAGKGAAAETPTQAPTRKVRGYSPRESYAAGDLIEHAKFGRGEVMEARAGKIEVRFGRLVRNLVHAG